MRRDKSLLIVGFVASAELAAGTYVVGFGWIASLTALFVAVPLTRVVIYSYFQRFLAFRTFEDFRSEKTLHECIEGCAVCCHLRVNLGKDYVERILRYSRKWAGRDSDREEWKQILAEEKFGVCCFLTCSGDTPRRRIYRIRPVACRLYPLVPAGGRLKADLLCPGFNKKKGQTFRQYLRTQEVGGCVKKTMGKI